MMKEERWRVHLLLVTDLGGEIEPDVAMFHLVPNPCVPRALGQYRVHLIS